VVKLRCSVVKYVAARPVWLTMATLFLKGLQNRLLV